MQSLYPFRLEKDKYLFNYLQENDLFEKSTWLTPFCSDNTLKSDASLISGVFNAFSRGIKDVKVKKLKFFKYYFYAEYNINCIFF